MQSMMMYWSLMIHVLLLVAMGTVHPDNPSEISYAGKWILMKTCVAGNCQDLPVTPCLEPLEIELYLEDWPIDPQDKDYRSTDRGLVVGKAHYKVCEIDPINFKYRMEDNACFHDIILDPARPKSWTIMGEGLELICKAELNKNVLLLHYVLDRYNFQRLDRREYYRRLE